jgi:hypothetical protein
MNFGSENGVLAGDQLSSFFHVDVESELAPPQCRQSRCQIRNSGTNL